MICLLRYLARKYEISHNRDLLSLKQVVITVVNTQQ